MPFTSISLNEYTVPCICFIAAMFGLAYMWHNRKLYVFPMASTTVAGNGSLLRVLYATETDDVTALQDEHQHLPIIYACAKAKQKDQKFAEATSLMSQFYQELAYEREDKHGRDEESLDMFKIKARGGAQGAK